MKKFLVAIFVAVSGIAIVGVSSEGDSCSQPGRLGPVCRAMKNLRSHIVILETQRELARVNFELLERTLSSFAQSIYALLTGSNSNVHVEKMEVVKMLTEKALVEAKGRDPEVFRTTNQIKLACQQCHNTSSPEGLQWEDVFRTNWGEVTGQCNEAKKNPFVCRQMNALVALFESFESSANMGRMDYEMAVSNAREIQRIARLLMTFSHPIHEGGIGPLKDVELRAIELEELARRKSPLIFEKALGVSHSCIQCHKVQ